MTLLIACILIYHFGLPWWLYVLAAAAFAGKLFALHLWETTQTRNMDGRFNMLNRLLQEQYAELRSILDSIEEQAKDVRSSCDDIQTHIREARRSD